jgi:hypothetical protein
MQMMKCEAISIQTELFLLPSYTQLPPTTTPPSLSPTAGAKNFRFWTASRMRPRTSIASSFFARCTAIIGRRRRDRHSKPKPKGPRVPRWLGRIMGQESSSPVDESVPPETLTARTLSAVAEYIKDGKAKRIVVLTGAGISTAAGSTLTFRPSCY